MKYRNAASGVLMLLAVAFLIHGAVAVISSAPTIPRNNIIGGGIACVTVSLLLGISAWGVYRRRLFWLACCTLTYIGLSVCAGTVYILATRTPYLASAAVVAIQVVMMPLYVLSCIMLVLWWREARAL